MKELNDKINNLKEQIENIKENQYKDLFEAVSGILSDLSSKVEEISLRQDYLEENMEFMDNDLTDIQDELFEEVSFDDLSSIEDEYVEIKCENCDKPLFVEQQALNNNSSIVTLSYYGAEKNIEGYNVMGIAKAALESSVRYLTKDLGKNGTRINAISAGPIKTLSAKGIKDFGNILDIVEEKSPLHRNVTAKEVGDCCTFLFSNMSSAITGEVIHVDNGFSVIGV